MIVNNVSKQNELIIRILREVKSKIEEQSLLSKEILDFKEACLYLKVSDSFLYKLTSKNEIIFSKPNGRKLYFQKRELDAWMLSKSELTEVDLRLEARNIMEQLDLSA
jgi:excisionase family DNA binding protein